MKIKLASFIIFMICVSCNSDSNLNKEDQNLNTGKETVFDQNQWKVKEGDNYPFRDKMLNDVVYNDTVRSLNKDQVLELLGKADKNQDNHLYYLIKKKQLFSWPLHTKHMVIKFTNDSTIEWIKIHE